MAIDILASARSTALVALVAASFSSPIVLQSDAFDQVSSRITGRAPAADAVPTDQIVAGGVEFSLPASWGQLGASAADRAAAGDGARVGTVVSGVCPGGSGGASCRDGVQVTFIAYSGKSGHALPVLSEFQDQLDSRLAKEFPGFAADEVRMRPGADGTRYLDYAFSWTSKGQTHSQRIAAYRHDDGSGVIAMLTGSPSAQQSKAVTRFLASAQVPVEPVE